MVQTMSNATSRLTKHCVLSGIPFKESRRLSNLIQKWVSSSGAEWTVARLKEMKQFILHCESAGHIVKPPPWISVHKDGSFKGPFRVLKGLTFQQQLSVLNAYTALRLVTPSAKQSEKAVKSISEPGVSLSQSRNDHLTALMAWPLLELTRKNFGSPDYTMMMPAGLRSGNPMTLTGSSWIDSFMMGLYNPHVGDFIADHFGLDPSVLFEMDPPWDDRTALSAGFITCIQERGCKARVVAMPNAALQCSLRPTHQFLNKVLMGIPTDCTFDQDKGAIFALKSLKEGKDLYSVDLSSATDRFPLHLQVKVMETLNLNREVQILSGASRAEWRLNPHMAKHYGQDFVRYGAGQPMGLYGSFAIFALTHNLLLQGVECSLNKHNTFHVLGDDVIINDGDVAVLYMNILKTMGVPISVQKSIESSIIGEFAGYIVHKNIGVFKPPKVPTLTGNNFLSYIKAFGPSAIKELPARVRPIARLVSQLPEVFGGLGQNPNGLSFTERCENFLFRDKVPDIPDYQDFFPKLLEAKVRYQGSAEERVVDFLYDQYSLSAAAMLDGIRKDLQGIATHQNQFSYQLSLLDERMNSALSWNTHSKSNDSFRQTDLDTWSSKFEM